MKQIIDGKRYDTETAEQIGREVFSTPNDFEYWEETLFRTQKGNFFFHGEGGAGSRYAKSLGNRITGGSCRIWKATEEEAKNWLARINPEKAESIFGEFPEA